LPLNSEKFHLSLFNLEWFFVDADVDRFTALSPPKKEGEKRKTF
jgi:hypothetical protein